MPDVRPAVTADADAIWAILKPILRAGETYALPRGWSRSEALAYWLMDGHEVFVAEEEGAVVGTYYLQANQRGGGAHVGNCGYATAPAASGRGVASAMCAHSLERAAERGFRAMQFNLVVSTNERAVGLWRRFGFETIGVIPEAFDHPAHGFVDALVLYRRLSQVSKV